QRYRPPPKLGSTANGPLNRPVRQPQAKDACHRSNSLLEWCKPHHQFLASLSRRRVLDDSAARERSYGVRGPWSVVRCSHTTDYGQRTTDLPPASHPPTK